MLFRNVVAAAFGLMVSVLPAAAQDFIAGIPRNEALIIQGPPAQNADWFNLWAPGGGANNNGLQQLTADTFWFINPEGDRRIRLDQRARDRAAGLQRRLHPDDGEAPRGHLLERRRRVHRRRRRLHRRDPDRASGHGLERAVHGQRRERRGAGPRTVVFNLKAPNSRFHTLFTVRWNAAWIMPKHVFEKVEDPLAFTEQPAGLAQRLRAAEL